MMNKEIYVSTAQYEETEYEQASPTLKEAEEFLGTLAESHMFDADLIDSMKVYKFAVDKIFVPVIQRKLLFKDQEGFHKKEPLESINEE